jgi:hypothetical protein
VNLDSVPLWTLFAIAVAIVMLSIEAGYRLGSFAHRRSDDEKESPVSNVAGAVLGLVAFMLAFAFGIVWDRYDDRKALVREEANAIRTAYVRSDFLPEPLDRIKARTLLKSYLGARLQVAQAGTIESKAFQATLGEAARIQRNLWDMAVANARKDMNSDVAALYLESLNEVATVHASRVAIGVQSRVPTGIWIGLTGLTVLGMMILGYHAGISASRRSMSTLVLAASFATVIALIATLDRPGGFIRVSQQPLADLQREIGALPSEDASPRPPPQR